MPRCRYCAAETHLYIDGTPVCVACSKQSDAVRKPPHTSAAGVTPANTALNAARDAYRQALRAQIEASAFMQSKDPENPEAIAALRNANRQLELASARYEEELREFIAHTSSRRSSG